ncbi:hypothetical protein AA101099_1751 [Neoasaia chiangmaiensis NBRC 101099]|nr:hypothetical protein AA101099_1751 [Neoasaia chiangmaiensis NBRC 101099]GEN14672.1 hypothetical protein NCH01_11030 [Neoasaia chiangmaiensis]
MEAAWAVAAISDNFSELAISETNFSSFGIEPILVSKKFLLKATYSDLGPQVLSLFFV